MFRNSLTISTLVACLAPPILADTIELTGGGHVTGSVIRRTQDGKIPHIVIRVDDGISIALPESRVNRVVTSDDLEEYRQLAAQVGDDPDRHCQLAKWCAASELPLDAQKRYHYQRAIALDPDHSFARAALGYVKDGNKWILYSQQQRNRGMIRKAGKWQLPEAVAIEAYQDETNEKAKRWIKEVARLRAVALRKTSKSEEAFQTLATINDPLAAAAIAKELENNKQPRRLRLLWIKLLGTFHNSASVYALTRIGLDDSNSIIREAALTELDDYGAHSAVDYYRQKLRSNSNESVRDALRALLHFPSRQLAFEYIDALVTEHKTEAPDGPGTRAGFSNTGGGSFSAGSKKKVVIEKLPNPAALSLLKTVEPGVDYGYDEQAWREHFARQLTSNYGDLRRDP